MQLKILIASVIFGILWVMFFVVHREYYISLTRQRLFVIRWKLFEAALEGKISFENPAYQLVRQTLNGMIRFTHDMSILRLSLIIFANRYIHKELLDHYNAHQKKAFSGLSNEQKELLLSSLSEAHWQIVRHVMSVSLFWILFKPASIVLRLIHKTNNARQWAMKGRSSREKWRRFDAEATYYSCEGTEGGLCIATF
ncbi:MAG TPA: hypothetical protein PLW81_03690 [Thiobacillaceae bacterium]|nr:hypothetical protein [Thiobacillaceae bacterium]